MPTRTRACVKFDRTCIPLAVDKPLTRILPGFNYVAPHGVSVRGGSNRWKPFAQFGLSSPTWCFTSCPSAESLLGAPHARRTTAERCRAGEVTHEPSRFGGENPERTANENCHVPRRASTNAQLRRHATTRPVSTRASASTFTPKRSHLADRSQIAHQYAATRRMSAAAQSRPRGTRPSRTR